MAAVLHWGHPARDNQNHMPLAHAYLPAVATGMLTLLSGRDLLTSQCNAQIGQKDHVSGILVNTEA